MKGLFGMPAVQRRESRVSDVAGVRIVWPRLPFRGAVRARVESLLGKRGGYAG